MKSKIALASRILLGLIFFVFGLNGFLQFIPQPPDLPASLVEFTTALANTGYFFPFVKGTEVVCGALLLLGLFVPLALTVLAPITLNIFLVHFFLTPGLQNIIMPTVIIILQLVLALSYWNSFKPMLRMKG